MTYSYKLQKDSVRNTTLNMVKRSKSGTPDLYIPFEPENTDYQEYLKWAETNTAEAAD